MVRSQDAQDRRSLQLGLTGSGSALLGQCMPVVQAVYLQAWSSIGDAATAQMQKRLRGVHQRLQSSEFKAQEPA